ncbi:FAD-binding domain-containing protein, partial [Basidiobolus meristosporus CBS 931.73]
HPLAVAYAETAVQVQQLVKCAIDAKVVVTPRSGGHSYEGFSSTTGTLVVDISKMNNCTATGTDTIRVEAGIQLRDLYLSIHKSNPGHTFAGGTCPTVGLGGILSSGGYGTVARRFGIGADHILSATVVNSKGEIVEVNDKAEPDLFWALKGGGGGTFGLVLSYSLKLVKTPENSMFHITWTLLDAVDVIMRFQKWAPTATDKLTMYFYQLPGILKIYGHYLGSMDELDAVLKESGLLDIGTAVMHKVSCSPLGAKMFFNFDDTCQDRVTLASQAFADITKSEKSYAKSLFIVREIPREVVIEYQKLLTLAPGVTYVNIEPHGGIFASQPSSLTAYPHRKGNLFHIGFAILVTGLPVADDLAHAWINKVHSLLLPYSNAGSYHGYADLDLPHPLQSYFGANVDRLVEVKRRYDPSNVFRNRQSIHP